MVSNGTVCVNKLHNYIGKTVILCMYSYECFMAEADTASASALLNTPLRGVFVASSYLEATSLLPLRKNHGG